MVPGKWLIAREIEFFNFGDREFSRVAGGFRSWDEGGEGDMKYVLMMQGTMADFEWYQKWPKEALQAQFGFMTAFDKELKESGKLGATVGLASPTHAKKVRAGRKGER